MLGTIFERSLDAAPDYVRPLLGQAQILEKTGRGAQAESLYQRAFRADPWSPDVHLNYGVWLAVQGRKEEAQRMFEEGLRLSPGDCALPAKPTEAARGIVITSPPLAQCGLSEMSL
jgi:Tfp pilus assembly protein PilF